MMMIITVLLSVIEREKNVFQIWLVKLQENIYLLKERVTKSTFPWNNFYRESFYKVLKTEDLIK